MRQCASLVLHKCMGVILRVKNQSEVCKTRRERTGCETRLRSNKPYNTEFSYIIDADDPAEQPVTNPAPQLNTSYQ